MLKKMKMQAIFLACIIAASSLQQVFAQTGTSAGTITSIATGWNADAFGVNTTAPMVNPAGCPSVNNYQAISTNPGYSTHYAALLTAYSTGSQVSFIISNTTCTQGNPSVIGVIIRPAS
ncbi:hypothetical protein ACFONN_07030 [Dyella humi]|uniref:Uncharacterized protein n=1 Tax=Dyella humi TaxID=1770547 RepID=A0ABW8IJC7_9GAMM